MRLGATLWIIVATGVFGSVVVRAQNLDCVNDSVCYEWVKRYDGGADAVDRAIGAVTNRDGSRLYVTGISTSAAGGPDFATVAYNAATGEQLWVARYDSPAHRDDEPFAFGTGNVIAITPDSSMLFVTGYTTETNGKTDYLTIAYHTADGSEAWEAQYSTPDASIGTSLALSADGKRLYATSHQPITATRIMRPWRMIA